MIQNHLQHQHSITFRIIKILIFTFLLLIFSIFFFNSSVAQASSANVSYEWEYCNRGRECAEGLVCDGNADSPESDGICVKPALAPCVSKLQPAYDIATKRCKVFSTPCNVPPDWQLVESCDDECFDVIQPAYNPDNGECKEFNNTCDVPTNWKKVPSCVNICLKIDQKAFYPETRECRTFESSCDIPPGWIRIPTCNFDNMLDCGGVGRFRCPPEYSCVILGQYRDSKGVCIKKKYLPENWPPEDYPEEYYRDDVEIDEYEICIQVIQSAVNPKNGLCREFPTPCDVPEGWKLVDTCMIEKEDGDEDTDDEEEFEEISVYNLKTGEFSAYNSRTRECKVFLNSRDIPKGWLRCESCDELKKYFPDTIDHWGLSYIQKFKDLGFVQGKINGNFDPDGFVTRAEALKIIFNAMKLTPSNCTKAVFQDVSPGSWYCSYVKTAKERTIVDGANNQFYPDRFITRAEAVKILLIAKRIYISEEPSNQVFNDVSLNTWYAKYIHKAFEMGIVKGVHALYFEPERNVTRAELVKMAAVLGGYVKMAGNFKVFFL